MTGFKRLAEHDIFSPIKVTGGKPAYDRGLGIEVKKEKCNAWPDIASHQL
jgi:hypothetical protein